MKPSRIFPVEDAQPPGTLEETGGGQSVAGTTHDQCGNRRASGIHVVFQQDFDESRKLVNALRGLDADRIGGLQVGHRASVATRLLQDASKPQQLSVASPGRVRLGVQSRPQLFFSSTRSAR